MNFHKRAIKCLLLLLVSLPALAASPSFTATNKGGASPWQCKAPDGAVISSHAQQYKAEEACANKALAQPGVKYTVTSVFGIEFVATVPSTPDPPPPPVTGTAALSWTAPTKNTDGTVLTGALTYKVYHGLSATALTDVVPVTGTSYTYGNLASGTHYFAVATVNSAGVESAMSAVGSKVIP